MTPKRVVLIQIDYHFSIYTEAGQKVTLEKREDTNKDIYERNAGCLGEYLGTLLILEHKVCERKSKE